MATSGLKVNGCAKEEVMQTLLDNLRTYHREQLEAACEAARLKEEQVMGNSTVYTELDSASSARDPGKILIPVDLDLKIMLEKMTCSGCGRIPIPYNYFLCEAGHVLCFDCGNQRIACHGQKCKAELNELMNDKDRTGEIGAGTTQNAGGAQTIEQNHFQLCQEKIKRMPADPFFTSIWSSNEWECPGCKERIYGRVLLDHLQNDCQPGLSMNIQIR